MPSLSEIIRPISVKRLTIFEKMDQIFQIRLYDFEVSCLHNLLLQIFIQIYSVICLKYVSYE